MSLDNFLGGSLDKYFLYEEPSIEFAANFIKSRWKSYVLVLFARCSVDYEGRASSRLSLGDYIILIKPDGTLLIHGPTKREPINWQPPGATITSFIENKNGRKLLVIRSRRYRPKELVLVKIEELYLLLGLLVRSGKFVLSGSEAEMVEAVMRNPEIIETGFKPIAREYNARYGLIDLLGRDSEGRLVVCEFKRRTADVQDVAQLALYVDSLRNDLGEERVRGILVAPGITDIALIALKEKGLEFRRFTWRNGDH